MPNSFLSEKARLEAQRRMLAERFGLLSDDSDEGEEQPVSTPSAPPANGNPNHSTIATSSSAPVHPLVPDAGSSSNTPTPPVTPAAESIDPSSPKTSAPVPASAAPQRTLRSDEADANHPDTSQVLQLIVDPAHGNMIQAFYDHTSSRVNRPSNFRDVRITPLTSYSSQLIDSHHRKIAVNDELVAYGVGGNVRVMLRHSSGRCLLKGHNAIVSDIEFLSFQETALKESNSFISILGSVADDGSVYIWKLIRTGEGSNTAVEIADAIRFEHPGFEKGQSYKRIAFRPGPNFIITENGIGVAMLLLDAHDSDLRIVELVKMNDKMMVRDRFLAAENETGIEGNTVDSPLDAAAWLSETVVVTSRGGHVFFWLADNNHLCCIGKVPRESKSPVTSILCVQPDALLFVVSDGRELEVWHVNDFLRDGLSVTITLQQNICLFRDSSEEVRCVVSVDPSEALVTVSNVYGSSLFVLHFNSSAHAFDAISEIPVNHPTYSFCLAPFRGSTGSVKPNTSFSSSNREEEVGVWCVHPNGIQIVHIPTDFYLPMSTVTPEVYPKPASVSVRRKDRKPLLVQSQSQNSGDSSSVSSNTDASSIAGPKRPGKSPSMARTSIDGNGSGLARTDTSSFSGETSKKVGSSTSLAETKLVSDSVRGREGTIASNENESRRAVGGVSETASKKGAAAVNEDRDDRDEFVAAILSTTKKVIQSFDDASVQRDSNEKQKLEKLVKTVTETAESNMEQFINSSMKKVLADTLIPGVSEMIADCRSAIKERVRMDSQLRNDHFEEAFQKAAIETSFLNACMEMERQVSKAVTDSMTAKYESLIQPSIEVVNAASVDLTSSVSMLKEELVKLRSDDDGKAEDNFEEIPEDVRQTIEEKLSQGNIDDAFLAALNKEDLEMVIWLCSKFDANQFFLENSLSQVCMMSLAQQLGQGLSDGDDVELKVDWITEVVLALEPSSDDIGPISLPAVQEILDRVNDLRKDATLLEAHPKLDRKLKALALLVSSHLIGGTS